MRGKSKTVVISDIHIGDNSPTTWYHRDVHEPYLAHVLRWVIDQRSEIRELVILGDLFDFWTYPADKEPPTLERIIAANPAILGPQGLLVQALVALEGQVTYLPGNHDLNITQADLNTICDPAHPQYRMRMAPSDTYIVHNGAVALAHGHAFTMFNAPDEISKLKPLPVGHFVTRSISYHLEQKGLVAAYEPGLGCPDGFLSLLGVSTTRAVLATLLRPDVAGLMLRQFANMYDVPESMVIPLPGGGTSSIQAAAAAYDGLFTHWVSLFGGDERGLNAAYKAVWADSDGSYMGWFAQRLAMLTGARIVVMGHTHAAKLGELPLVNYVNTGFMCPARPDLESGKQIVTLAVIEEDPGSGAVKPYIYRVVEHNGDFALVDYDPGPDSILGSRAAEDYSCYMELYNGTDHALQLVGAEAAVGAWVVPPPSTIAARSVGRCWIQDPSLYYELAKGAAETGALHLGLGLGMLKGVADGLSGSAGTATYRSEAGGRNITVHFSCPVLGFNSATAEGATTQGGWGPTGHPLVARFHTISGASFSASGRGASKGVLSGGVLVPDGQSILVDGQKGTAGVIPGIRDIRLRASESGLYTYTIEVDGGSTGVFAKTNLSFSDQSGDTYSLLVYADHTHTVRYNSPAPAITRITWST